MLPDNLNSTARVDLPHSHGAILGAQLEQRSASGHQGCLPEERAKSPAHLLRSLCASWLRFDTCTSNTALRPQKRRRRCDAGRGNDEKLQISSVRYVLRFTALHYRLHHDFLIVTSLQAVLILHRELEAPRDPGSWHGPFSSHEHSSRYLVACHE